MDNHERVAVLLVGYGEVEQYRDFASYNELALRLLAAKFLKIPEFGFRLLARTLARKDTKEWAGRDNFRSPHNAFFEAQRAGIEAQLHSRFGERVRVFKTFNFCEGDLPDQVLARIRAQGFRRLLVYPLLVVDSIFTSGLALQQINEALAAEERWVDHLRYLPSFYDKADYHTRLAGHIESHHARLSARHQPSRIGVVLINHGCPCEANGFTTGIEESQFLYERVRERLICRYPLVSIGWLNHETPGRWTIPDVAQAARNLLAIGAGTLVFCPIGFVTENHETILDVEAIMQRFEQKAIPCTRLDCLNDDPAFLEAAAGWVAPLVEELLTERSIPAVASRG